MTRLNGACPTSVLRAMCVSNPKKSQVMLRAIDAKNKLLKRINKTCYQVKPLLHSAKQACLPWHITLLKRPGDSHEDPQFVRCFFHSAFSFSFRATPLCPNQTPQPPTAQQQIRPKRGLDPAILRQAGAEGGGDLHAALPGQILVYGDGAHHGGGGAGQAEGLSRSISRHEFAAIPRRHLPDWRELLEHTDGAGQPFCRLVVVPQGICPAGRLQGQDPLAQFSGNQLPRQHLAQWQADREVG